MRFYLATVSADDLRWATDAGLCDGVVATPAVLAAEVPQADPREVLGEIAEWDPLESTCRHASLSIL